MYVCVCVKGGNTEHVNDRRDDGRLNAAVAVSKKAITVYAPHLECSRL